jgi:plasmid stabilization system protein ParE
MRRIVFAPSFDHELEAIGAAIEARFGEGARRAFVADLARLCDLIAQFPRIGTSRHGYDSNLVGVVFRQNWVFFDFDNEEVHFLHIANARRDRGTMSF